MSRPNSLGALLAVALLLGGRAAPLATCACPDCPVGGSCTPQTAAPPPCCADETDTPPVEKTCECPHLEAPDGVTEAEFLAFHPDVIDAASPDELVQARAVGIMVPTPRGPGPPGSGLPLFLRDLDFRL